MLKCQNCQKMCEEYYCMPDNNTILCESCWKKGLALMQLHAKRLREIPLELEQLNHLLIGFMQEPSAKGRPLKSEGLLSLSLLYLSKHSKL